MNLSKSPYFEADTYDQNIRCYYCGYLNTAYERHIRCRYSNPEKSSKLEWYIWCQACNRFTIPESVIYTLVKERLLKRQHCFQFEHRCGKVRMMTPVDEVQEKCGEHKDCWLYLCKKCAEMIHVSKIHKDSLERLKNREENRSGLLIVSTDEEEIQEDVPLLSN
jgi:hypothetical protein